MHGEFSRLTFDPRKHVSGVLQQQGRVGLDSDWNEWVEATLRRLTIETIDVIGTCGRPQNNAGFGISVANSGTANPAVKLSAGRLYAGGMLAELESQTDFLAQYDWPIPTHGKWTTLFGAAEWPGLDFSTLAAGSTRRDLFYAEVWQRHITSVNDEAERDQGIVDASPGSPEWNARPEVGDQIRESALGGPDTCTRLQTVAQVKYFTVTGQGIDTCEEACAALSTARPKATTGKLRVDVVAAPPVVSPCQEAQIGGYGGAENRTYRVQIHTPGAPGTATFKYSTENGAFMVRIDEPALTSVAAGANITLLTIGNDQTVQLKAGQWVEICGEETELCMFRNPLAQLVADPVALANGKWSIALTAPVVIPRAPFLRRWSEDVQTIALGVLFPLDIGSGLSVEFADRDDGTNNSHAFFHELDYWIWSARTITRAVEPKSLTETPQKARGIERAYCCLALVTWSASGGGVTPNITATTIDECDNEFPPLTDLPEGGRDCCCCTITVGDGRITHGDFNDLADAFAHLPDTGGIVCILPGDYRLDAPIRIRRDDVVVHGCGSHMRIRASHGAFIVEDQERIVFTGLVIETQNEPAIFTREVLELKVLDSQISVGRRSTPGLSIGARDAEIARNLIDGQRDGGGGIELASRSANVWVHDNQIVNGALQGISLGTFGADGTRSSGALRNIEIEHNRIDGMDLEGIGPPRPKDAGGASSTFDSIFVRTLRIEKNEITRCLRGDLMIPGQAVGAITLLDVEHAEIYGNRIEDNGVAGHGAENDACGILIGVGAGLRIHDNTIQRNGRVNRSNFVNIQAGIVVAIALPAGEIKEKYRTASGGDGWPSISVCRNVVASTRGPALVVTGLGRMLFAENQLTARGYTAGKLRGATVDIRNYGMDESRQKFSGWSSYTPVSQQVSTLPPVFLALASAGGDVLFSDNQCLFEAVDTDPPAENSILIETQDSLGFAGNQARFTSESRKVPLPIHANLYAIWNRVENNRFTEPLEAPVDLSCHAAGVMTTGIGNQGTHCMVFAGTDDRAVALNLVSPAFKDKCKRVGDTLASLHPLYTVKQG